MTDSRSWQALQGTAHGTGFDYAPTSPHLTHAPTRTRIADAICSAVGRSFHRRGDCRVLEIGAGHGAFTEYAAAAGATVSVTEMSSASVDVLRRRFMGNSAVRVIHDADGEQAFRQGAEHDVVLYLSVLHHIPDYLGHLKRLLGMVSAGGDVITYQDPLWYPGRSRLEMVAQRGAYFYWRLGQGDLAAGLRTRMRRLRGVYDPNLEADMVEYHVVRQGVDEHALLELLERHFAVTRLDQYWSTQSRQMQRLGERVGLVNTFGLVAVGRLT